MKPSYAFAGAAVPRRPEMRGDAEGAAALIAQTGTRILPFWRGKPLAAAESELCWLAPTHRIFAGSESPVFVGMEAGAPRFAAALPDWNGSGTETIAPGSILDQSRQHHPHAPGDAGFVNLRRLMTALSEDEAERAAMGKALLEWHAFHRCCPCCGARTEVSHAGWQQRCRRCGTVHFCRTDPAVIMLVTHRNSALIGRSHGWPPGMHSLLAGFMEPGETIEAAVRRETFEETGVTVNDVRYLASQPWPFPASLMIGCAARAATADLRVDADELEGALWVSRERMREIYTGRDSEVLPPRRGSIAEHVIGMWLRGRIT